MINNLFLSNNCNGYLGLVTSYLAACMEYAVIFEESPSVITYVPDGLSVKEAQDMRLLADEALNNGMVN